MLKSGILDDLGRKHGTDKCSGDKTHDYLRKYEFFLRPWRDEEFTFLELGVFKGASLRTWSDYFSKAEIVGVDNEVKVKEFDTGRGKIIIGDLSNNDFLESLIPLNPKVVLDDASHWWPDQLRALFTLYQALQSGGIYILEDIHTSFEPLAPHFSAGLDTPPFYLLLKIAEYMTGNDRPSPIIGNRDLVPLTRADKFNTQIRILADMTDAIIFIERACLLYKK
ncbi:MAG: class I SAM-dependent methyltransferase [Deltaproteobacteria bacterium]|jgi:hypothetical protein|nr:class I SAM-dependent methyltransferase [Deltaproteobacteria bacterium]